MNNQFPNETNYKVWKLICLHAENNMKIPLGLISLLVATDPILTPDHSLEIQQNTKEREIEF